jgi:hypothetical protein
MDATTGQDRLSMLMGICSKRGYQRTTPILLIIVGLMPAVLLTLTRTPGSDDSVLIAGLFALVPGVLLLRWSMRDRDGAAARELGMWLRVVSKSAPHDIPKSVQRDFDQLATDNPQFAEVALDVRDDLAPLVDAPISLAIRINIYRFWYAVIWVLIAALVLIGFFIVSGPSL